MNQLIKIVVILAAAVTAVEAPAAVSPEEAEQLGTSLTPYGAEQAANAVGSIPAWEGGYTHAPPGFLPGQYSDPFAADRPLFTIDSSNAPEHAANLTPGQVALFKRYSDWKMKVYPTRRSAAFPAGVYAETKRNATTVKLAEGGNGIVGTTGGLPFPIPKSGLEAIWNHLTAYRGETYAETWSQAAVTTSGDYTLVKFDYEYDFVYGNQRKKPEQREPNLLFYFMQVIRAPARLAGGIILVHEFANQVTQPRKAWSYSPGQRRVRLAPNVAYDNPGVAADGLRTNDDFYMYNGATDRYDWKLVGKKEIYVPYNAYRLNSPKTKVGEVLRKGHINPDLARYELHRVWVVDSTLRSGTSHLYKRRTFYLDEDSWKVLVTDKYDNRGQLWRVDEEHTIEYYDQPFLAPGLEVKHDLQSGRYIVMRLREGERALYRPIKRTPSDFTPDAVRARGTR